MEPSPDLPTPSPTELLSRLVEVPANFLALANDCSGPEREFFIRYSMGSALELAGYCFENPETCAAGVEFLTILVEQHGTADFVRDLTAQALYVLGMHFHEKGDPSKARSYLERSARDGCCDAALDLGKLAMAEGDPESAELWFSLFPDDIEAVWCHGVCCEAQGETEAARELYLKAADADFAKAHLSLALLHLADENTDDAVSSLLAAAAGGEVEAMFGLGCMAFDGGRLQIAHYWLTRAVDLGHDDAQDVLAALVEEAAG